MIFKPAEPNINWAYREVSDGNFIEIGIYPVLYGMRVRAAFVGNQWSDIDWCCGLNQQTMNYAFSLLKYVLGQREENRDAFKGLPTHSRIKPFTSDLEFLAILGGLMPDNLTVQKLPTIQKIRDNYLQNHFHW